MEEQTKNQIINYDKQLAQNQEQFLLLLGHNGLPTENIFVPIKERVTVFSNAGSLLSNIDIERKAGAVYISKFFAAVSAGLFDAALNYIWDETIIHLRKRVEVYDLEYFYDIAASADKRKDLKTIDDISKLTDDELLRGSLKIDLISDIGYRNIDLVRYMRNNVSAAHPNQMEITGLKLVSMAEDCLREVISTPIPPAAIVVQRLLENIKNSVLSTDNVKSISVHFSEMGPARTQRLAEGFFGIFYKRETSESVRQNIRLLIPLLWTHIDENTRKGFGLKHAYFSANSHTLESGFAREFLAVAGGLGYITDQHKALEILSILDELMNARSGFNNFYTEVLPARKLQSVIGIPPSVPKAIESDYTTTLVNLFLTNGNGESWSANEIYTDLINNFTPRQAVYSIALIFDETISSKLRFPLCENKYLEMVEILTKKISNQAAIQLIEEILVRRKNLTDIRTEDKLKKLARMAVDEMK